MLVMIIIVRVSELLHRAMDELNWWWKVRGDNE